MKSAYINLRSKNIKALEASAENPIMRYTLTTKALILAIHPSREKDRRIELLSPETGKIFATAKGAKNMASPFIGRLQPLNICTLMLYKSGAEKWTILEATLEKIFPEIKKNLEKISAGLKIIETLQKGMRENEMLYDKRGPLKIDGMQDDKIFNLAVNSLDEMEKSKKPHLVFETFRIKFLDSLGLMPEITHCEKCFKKIEYQENMQWSVNEVICKECKKNMQNKNAKQKNDSSSYHERYRKLLSFLQKRPLSAINLIQWHKKDENTLSRIGMEYWQISGNQKLQTEKILL